MKGKKHRNGYNERFLENSGEEPVSTIAMKENAFLTEKVWAEISEKVVMCL